MSQDSDIFIVGGGVVGLSAAIAMRQQGFAVQLFDAHSLQVSTHLPDARVYALNQASQQLLTQLDVWPLLDKTRLAPYRHMHIWDAANGATLDFDVNMIGRDRLGTIVEESVLKQALLQQAEAMGVVLHPNYTVTQVQPQHNHITISDGILPRQTQLLMIADGAQSALRHLLRVPLTSWPYHHHAIVAIVQSENPHQATAYQVFNRDGPLAFLPLANPYQSSIVWSTSPQKAQYLMSLDATGFAEELNAAFARHLGQNILLSPRYQFPLIMRHVKHYCGTRWLLLGDAAHTIHPLAGLGLNIGFADLSSWLNCMHTSYQSKYGFSQQLLGYYQRQRKSALWQSIALMESIKMLFANPLPPVVLLRRMGINICQQLLPLKRQLIEYAAG